MSNEQLVERLLNYARNNRKLIKMRKWPDVIDGPLVKLNYAHGIKDWTDEICQSRGIIIDMETNHIVARPFDKFFNLGEKLQLEDLPKDEDYAVIDKLDGVLVIPFKWNDMVHFSTRGSFDNQFTEIINHDSDLRKTIRAIEGLNYDQFTYIFELIHPDAKILTDYGDAKELVLLGVRHTESGDLLPPEEVRRIAQVNGLVHAKPYPDYDLREVLFQKSNAPYSDEPKNHEGFVIHFEGGLLIKIKRDEYVQLVRIVKKVSVGNFIDMMMNAKYWDYKAKLPEEVLPIATEIETAITRKWVEVQGKLEKIYDSVIDEAGESRKDIALKLNSDPELKEYLGGVFLVYDNKSPNIWIWQKLKKNKQEYFPNLDNIVPGVDR